ncbi:MAG: hypothetical protein IJY39_02615 [Clostridia bacterium]|nr:hypothetical protein [Clostridia bacterium]
MNEQPKLSKQEKESINYFVKTDTLKFVGAGLLIAGLLCMWLGFRLGIVGWILAIVGAPTGFVLFIIGTLGRATDADMESVITQKMSGLEIGIDNEKHYQLKLLKHLKEVTIEGYRFHDGIMIKKLKDGSLRTPEYARSMVKILKDSLYIVSREISLINDDVINNTYEIFYDSIQTVEIVREHERVVFNNNTYVTKPCYFHVVYDGGEINLPIVDAITSDELVDNIKRQMQIYSEQK